MRVVFVCFIFLICSCSPQHKKTEFVLVVDANDTVPPDSFYFAKIYLKNKPADLKIEGYYFWDRKIPSDNDTAYFSFNTSCPSDSIIDLRITPSNPNKYFEKFYKIYLKGSINGRDTVIEKEKSYYVDCTSSWRKF